jgi:hypothetical protein
VTLWQKTFLLKYFSQHIIHSFLHLKMFFKRIDNTDYSDLSPTDESPVYQLDEEVDLCFYFSCESYFLENDIDNGGDIEQAGYTDNNNGFWFYFTVETVDVALGRSDKNGITLSSTSVTPAGAPVERVLQETANKIWQRYIADWKPFDEGKTMGKWGSENGTIILDLEYRNSARITVEEKTRVAPFALTMGIYGMMFHTAYFSTREEVNEAVEHVQFYTKKILDFREIPKEKLLPRWVDNTDLWLGKLVV